MFFSVFLAFIKEKYLNTFSYSYNWCGRELQMRIKKLVLFSISLVLLFSLLTSPVFAIDFSVERQNINFRIGLDEVAKFNVTVTNYLPQDSIYAFSLPLGDSLNWIMFPSNVQVPALSSETFVLSVTPRAATPTGVYQLNVVVRSDESRQDLPLPIDYSFDGFHSGFTPNLETIVVLPEAYDPRERAIVGIRIRNRNPLDIEEAEIRVLSDLFSGSQKISISPGPHRTLSEGLSKEMVFQMDPLQAPGDYEVRVQIYYPKTDRVVSEDAGFVRVKEYSSTPSKLETSSQLFITTHTITVENFGNKDSVAEIRLAGGWIKKLFSTFSLEPEFEHVEGETYFLWTPTLQPTESKVITVRTNYWPLVITILIILLVVFLYFKLRSPVVLDKEVAVIDEDEGTGSSDLRVRLFVKNRTGKSVTNLTVSDKVRGITDYVESTQLGHVKPSRTTKTSKKGTLLFWDLDELEPFEERIFTYKLKSKLKVVGDLTLPKAAAKFESFNSRERRISSSKPFFKKVKKKKVKE
jgi:hypothetical protein